jgi:NodT family efflux transporter outer membrane factor (OMF) lipoprotein
MIRQRHILARLASAILLCGCVHAPEENKIASRVTVPAVFQEQAPDGEPTGAQDLSRWWTLWHDPTLEGLIDEALQANTDIRTARAHVAEARAMVTVAESALYPTVAAQGTAWGGEADWRLPGSPTGIPPGLLPSISPGFYGSVLGLGARWEPDVFGGRRADTTAARAMASSAVQSLNGARMTVVADVAEHYEEARSLERRLDVLDRGISTLEQLLSYVEARYEAGQALAHDADTVRQQLEVQRAKRPPLLALLEARKRRLAVLRGTTAESSAPLAPSPALTIPPPPTGLVPVQVLDRRPDVQARSAQVLANTARLASARKDVLPRFNIEFLGGDGELHFNGLPNFGSTAGLISLTAYLPLFTAGRIRANIAASDARLEAAVANYDAAVLKALEDVENAYRFRGALDQRRESIAAALAAARRNETASKALYEGGRSTFRDVLDDRIAVLSDEDELIQAETGQVTATIQLYRALGGGW